MELVEIGAECLDRRFDFFVNKMVENMWRNGNYSAFGFIVTEKQAKNTEARKVGRKNE